MGLIKQNIYSTINQLHEELDNTYELKKTLNYETEFGELVSTLTRIKILKEFIYLFKLTKSLNNNSQAIILERISFLTKRVKIHFNQLSKIETRNHYDNVMYFTTLMKVLYQLLLQFNKKN